MTRTARLARLQALERRQPPTQPLPDAVTLVRQAGLTPDAWQEQALTSPAPRALWVCCRQSGKSTCAAALSLACALQQPGALVLVVSPTLRQSSELFHKVMELYGPVAHLMPATQESALRLTLCNGARIISLPGTESTIRGYASVALLVVDEAARVRDELYYAIRPMLAISRGRMVCLSTPWGKRGWFYKEWTQGEHWQQVQITADQCPRISAAFLEEERRSLPALFYASEYLCSFEETVQQLFTTAEVLGALSPRVTPLWE
jgi:hypothetical protein